MWPGAMGWKIKNHEKLAKIAWGFASFYQYISNLMRKPSSPGIPVASYDKAQ